MIARLLLAWAALAGTALAQELPRPWYGSVLKGVVVDADSNQPIAGAVLVARWAWLSGSLQSSAGFGDLGEALHVSEAVSDAQGRFMLAGFGPTVRGMGQVEQGAPLVTVFKSGYEPFQRLAGKDPPGAISIKRHTGTSAELAAKIAAIQGDFTRGLHWLSEKPSWQSMPRMVEALHREKVRLGDDGRQIRSAHRLAGRAGAGTIADAATGKGVQAEKLPGEPYWPGAVWVSWTMRRIDGSPGSARLTYTRSFPVSESPSKFTLSPWTIPGPDIALPGWEAVKDAPPTVRVHAFGYRRSAEQRWPEEGATVRLEKVASAREAIVENVRALRREVDAELQGNRERAIADHRPLLVLLGAECRALTPDLRAGICFPDDSDVAVELRRMNVVGVYDRVVEDGPELRYFGQGQGSRIEARRVTVAPGANTFPGMGQGIAGRKPVAGFSIERAR